MSEFGGCLINALQPHRSLDSRLGKIEPAASQNDGYTEASRRQKVQKHTTAGIRQWSPT
jgi:hypothetical protein